MFTTFCGPKIAIEPSELDKYDNGSWSCEVKHDGNWCEIKTDASGKIVKLTSRSGKTFDIPELKIQTNLISSTFIAELEHGTEAASKLNCEIGFKRLHVFDVETLMGMNVRLLPYLKRRELLEIAFRDEHSIIKLVERRATGFASFFREVELAGGEGLVLKKNDSIFPHGKTDDWIRCKKYRYVDYVIVDVKKSEGGSDNFQVGLFIDGTLKRVATVKNIPAWIKDPRAHVGRVIECKGREVHESGALRHGHFERFRDDKVPEECTLAEALNQGL